VKAPRTLRLLDFGAPGIVPDFVNRPTTSEQEDRELRDAGFDPAASADAAVAKLGEIRAAPSAPEAAIARALGKIADAAAAAMLAEMEMQAGGPLRREVRRALYKLRQRGITAPEGARPQTRPQPSPPPGAGTLSALLSPIDAEGARIVWILKPRAQGGVTRLWGVVSEDDGLVGIMTTGLTRRELRDERGELERRAGFRFVEGDWRLADFVLCEAWRRTPEARRARAGDFLAVRAELIPTPPPEAIEHPIYSELASQAQAEPAMDLLREPEMIQWRLPAATIREYVEEIERAGESVIVLNELQQRERVNMIVERAIAELLSGPSRERIRRRFEDIGYYLLRAGRRREAGWAAAAAAKLRSNANLQQDLFFQSFIRTQLGTVVAAEQERAREEPRLIVTPAEAMRATETRRRRR
jgi:hypothetical protein